MKTIIYSFIACITLLSGSSVKAQNDSTDKQAMQMLTEFYTAYNTAWAVHSAPDVLIKRLDSLQSKYCTIKLRAILKKEFKKNGLDHDLLLNDQGTDIEHLKTLTVTKDATKSNAYIVSYTVHTTRGYKPIDIKVIIHVSVVKEHGKLKIASTDMSK
ncbi:MAG TPA: hypothetical protein VG367_10605 [Mucilaginibacter sp.]|jgi:hypothetical protein|nr:hypothetical protein [Mucilaginibacter sp.]